MRVTRGQVARKIDRLHTGGHVLTVVDLFAGCGGFSLGFQRAGFKVLAGVEKEEVRALTFVKNLLPGIALDEAATDICALGPNDVLKKFQVKKGEVDGIIGGPPCQAYARIGRAKLREIGKAPQAYVDDPRGRLYERYLEWVAEVAPLFIVMENVPDILSVGGVNIAEAVAEQLDEMGYETRYTLLNAAGYGVPQFRERLFLIGTHTALRGVAAFPPPTCSFELPDGFRGTRAHAYRVLSDGGSEYISALPECTRCRRKAVTAFQALSDLPRVGDRLRAQGKGRRKLSEALPYHGPACSAYQREMRTWPPFETDRFVSGNESRYLPRDFNLFARMREGEEYPEAHSRAQERLQEALSRLEQDNVNVTEALKADLRKAFVPPYDPEKFPNKWRKLERSQPARTLMAHLSHDSYTHIHYDDLEARTITVREAARLQSFPDGFQFEGAMNAAFAQIGNAVPPLLAYALARQLKATLTSTVEQAPRPGLSGASQGARPRSSIGSS